MTEMEMFAAIADRCSDCEEIVEFCEKKMTQLEKRKNAPRKPRFNTEANQFALRVYDMLKSADGPVTNKELVEEMTAKGIVTSPQKVAAALARLVNGKVVDGDDPEAPVLPANVIVSEEGRVKTFVLAQYMAFTS